MIKIKKIQRLRKKNTYLLKVPPNRGKSLKKAKCNQMNREEKMKKKRSQRKNEPNGVRGGFIWQFFRQNYRRTLIVASGIKFRR